MSSIEKHCYTFMKNLNFEDYSYKGQKSAIQSDDTGMFMEDFMHGLGNNNLLSNNGHNNNTTAASLSHNIFGLTNASNTDDRHSYISAGDNTFGRHKDFQQTENANQNVLPKDHQIQEWVTEQKYKQIQQQSHQISQSKFLQTLPTQRLKYWGEPVDSTSIKQIQKDNYIYKEFQNKLYLLRQGKDEQIFRIERDSQNTNANPKSKKGQESINSGGTSGQDGGASVGIGDSHQIKDIKEYEYFKNQEKHFYTDDTKKVSVNKIMRNLELELGMITEEEFYAQEELEDQLEQKENQQQQLALTASSTPYASKQQPKSMVAIQQKATITQGNTSNNPLALTLQQQQRKEQVLNDFIDNFDVHFERRKKELHEVMLKKIQQHEKANQQTSSSGQQQTVAYASGSHALLQATASGLDSGKGGMEGNRDKIKHMVNMSKLREDQEYGLDRMNDQMIGNQDEEMMGDDMLNHNNSSMLPHLKSHDQPSNMSGAVDDNQMRLRVTKSRANELNHAKCILKLSYTRFDWSEQALMNFHRPNIHDVFDQTQYERERDYKQQMEMYQIQQQQQQYQMQIDGQQLIQMPHKLPPYVQLKMKVLSNDQVDKRPKKVGIINAHEFFRDRFKLSLKDGKFCVFEHIDQQPLFVNNFGMASKLKRYLYSDKFLPDSAFLKRRENQGTRHMGPHGVQILKKKGEKIPLLGQIDTKYLKGITVMENNMYYCPVFYYKPQRNDFLCVVHRDKQQNPTIVVRELSELYVMGQEEPKLEVYNPQSRQYQHFIKRRTQAYVIRFLQENHNSISFQELNKFFLYINDQILKKIIKEINVEVDRNQYCSLSQEYNDEQFRQLITPENICQYESAQYGEQMLKKVGIRDITNADKISYATNKFCSEEPNQKKQLIARIIEEEVLSTPWNLSQNFIHNKQTRGMMMLEGIGDPSHGHGGYSYLKLPLKISQDSLNKAKINRMYLNPAIQNPKAVTGTDADLRKLSKKEIKNKLIDLGFKEEAISSFTRWEMVALLRDKSSQAVSQGMEGEMKKFARGVRFTSKKQREMYQKQVNDIFKKQMSYLSKESGDFIQDYSDTETRDQRQKKINDVQQMNNAYSKNIVELKEDIEIKSIKDIPNFEILIMANQAIVPVPSQPGGALNIGSNSGLSGAPSSIQTGYDPNTGILDREAAAQALKQKLNEGMTYKCTILRKKIKPVNGTGADADKIERVLFCSDPRQIKGFNKRKHKHEVKIKRTKKTSLKDKMQTHKPINDDFKDRRERSETSSVLRHPNLQSKGGPLSTKTNVTQEPVKIKLGHLTGNILSDPSKLAPENTIQPSIDNSQPIRIMQNKPAPTISIPIGGTGGSIKIGSSISAQNHQSATSNTISIMQPTQQSNVITLAKGTQQQQQQPIAQSSSFKINIANVPLQKQQPADTTISLGLGGQGTTSKQKKPKTYDKYMHSSQALSNQQYDDYSMQQQQTDTNMYSANVPQQQYPLQYDQNQQQQMYKPLDQQYDAANQDNFNVSPGQFLAPYDNQQQQDFLNQTPPPQITDSSIKIGISKPQTNTTNGAIAIPNVTSQPTYDYNQQIDQQQQQQQTYQMNDTIQDQAQQQMQYSDTQTQQYQQQAYNPIDYTNSMNTSDISAQTNNPNPSPITSIPTQQYQQPPPTTIRLGQVEPVKISLGGLNTSQMYGGDQSYYDAQNTTMNTSAQQTTQKKSNKPKQSSSGVNSSFKEEKKKNATSSASKQKKTSKQANTTGGYNDDDFETYKPKSLQQNQNRRRQASGAALLNEFFGSVIEACMNKDKHKLFHLPVKKKDAPNYYDVIKNVIALSDMKAKVKREDYQSRDQFMSDLQLMRSNAEAYNGEASHIAEMARDIERLAQNMIDQEENMLLSYELLIQEQFNQTLRI